uniref:CTCK domain-containing protein n=1 Tax=Mesocestoides corti TaxID=53468 RepID=A0A5K3FLH6_MESCO
MFGLSMKFILLLTLCLNVPEAKSNRIVNKTVGWDAHPDRQWNSCLTLNTLLYHGEILRPDCRTECLCDDGVLLCRDMCASESYNCPSSCDSFQNQNPPESLCKSEPPLSTQWSPCSKTCGLGVSFRVTNNNTECRNQTEAQLCHWKPCSKVFIMMDGLQILGNEICKVDPN